VILADAGVLVAAFCIGAIPFGVLVSRAFFRRDIRSQGSGNIGAANALRTLGKRGAVAVLALDALKGAIAVWLGRSVGGGDELAAAAALLAVAGHCFSPFLGFRGGKGVATSFGAILALAWPAGLAFAAIWLAVVMATGYSSAGSILASIGAAPALGLLIGSAGWAYGGAAAAIVIVKHRENIARLRAGTESVLPLFGRGKSKA
jgi:glycerol-3-phosphate acyltransferase PlsY